MKCKNAAQWPKMGAPYTFTYLFIIHLFLVLLVFTLWLLFIR